MSTNEEQAREIAHWQVLAVRARSFRWAAAFLSRAQRQRVVALYAFCRAVDDLADAEWVTPEARQDLDKMRSQTASRSGQRATSGFGSFVSSAASISMSSASCSTE